MVGEHPINRDVLPDQKIYKIDGNRMSKNKEMDIGVQARWPVITNNLIHTYSYGEPGDVYDWHTHMPDVWQVWCTIQGEWRWTYRDSNGDEHSVEAGPGDWLVCPGGLENKIDIIGDEPHLHTGVIHKPPVLRHEHLLGTQENYHDPRNIGPAGIFEQCALEYDEARDIVRVHDDNAVVVGPD